MDFGLISQALAKTGSSMQLPQAAGTAAEAAGTAAPAAQTPQFAQYAQKASDMAGQIQQLPDVAPSEGEDGVRDEDRGPGLKEMVGKVGKIAGLVASFYTGGAAGAAMNLGGQALTSGNG